jgi:hypothetical protein
LTRPLELNGARAFHPDGISERKHSMGQAGQAGFAGSRETTVSKREVLLSAADKADARNTKKSFDR